MTDDRHIQDRLDDYLDGTLPEEEPWIPSEMSVGSASWKSSSSLSPPVVPLAPDKMPA